MYVIISKCWTSTHSSSSLGWPDTGQTPALTESGSSPAPLWNKRQKHPYTVHETYCSEKLREYCDSLILWLVFISSIYIHTQRVLLISSSSI